MDRRVTDTVTLRVCRKEISLNRLNGKLISYEVQKDNSLSRLGES
jgi:hypothetical protein